MPIYEYECRACQERFEVVQKISDTGEELHCPKCDTDRPQRLLSAFCSIGGKSGGGAPTHSSPGHS